jgi:1-acylglycerone phosphate reductase
VEKMDGLDKNIHRLALDVNSDEAVASVVSTIIEREGRIDMLLNNAGVDTVRESVACYIRAPL